jgi:hypothetical protein
MKAEQAFADVQLKFEGQSVRVRALADAGASRSVISKDLAERLGSPIPLKEPYELKTADKGGKLKIVGRCMANITFQGVEVPGGGVFEVAENLREDVQLIIGRPEIDSWDIIFTPEGPKPRRVPIEFEIL